MIKPPRDASILNRPPRNVSFGIGIVLVTLTISFFAAYAYLLP